MGRQSRSSGHRPPLSATAHGHADSRGGGGGSRRRSHASDQGRHLGRHHVAYAQGVVKGILHSPTGRAGVIFAFSVFVFLHQTLSLYRPALVTGLTRNLSAVKWSLSWPGGGGGWSRAPLRQANWYRDEAASRPESGGVVASGGGVSGRTMDAPAARPGFGVVPVPDGVHPLPNLTTERAGALTADDGATADGGAAPTHTRFSAWAVSPSLAGGVGVPPFLRAASSAPSPGMETAPSSVYTVRKPQGWWGCERPYWVACKGVYRAIKRLDAVSVMDINCLANADFLPVVFSHLRREFRSIRFVCAERDADRLAAARAKYASVDAKTSYMTFDPFATGAAAAYPPRLDVVLAVGAFVGQSLISSMRLFRSLHASGAVRYVVFDNYPTLDNAPSAGAAGGTARGGTNQGRINVYKGPFLFPVAKYTYENATEKYGSEENQIMALAVADLFSTST